MKLTKSERKFFKFIKKINIPFLMGRNKRKAQKAYLKFIIFGEIFESESIPVKSGATYLEAFMITEMNDIKKLF